MQQQTYFVQVNEEASEKVLQVEQEYNLRRQPLYKERNEVIKQIPEFWTQCFRLHENLRELITVEDEQALAYLVEVRTFHSRQVQQGLCLASSSKRKQYL
jgi:template-activating factor I